jgi:hypothetical protein
LCIFSMMTMSKSSTSTRLTYNDHIMFVAWCWQKHRQGRHVLNVLLMIMIKMVISTTFINDDDNAVSLYFQHFLLQLLMMKTSYKLKGSSTTLLIMTMTIIINDHVDGKHILKTATTRKTSSIMSSAIYFVPEGGLFSSKCWTWWIIFCDSCWLENSY